MKKLTDQELDLLFKEASEGFQPAFDGVAWEAMSEKFKTKPKSAVWKKWLPFSLAGFIIFSGGVWVGRNYSDEQEFHTEINTGPKSTQTVEEAKQSQELQAVPIERSKVTNDKPISNAISNSNADFHSLTKPEKHFQNTRPDVLVEDDQKENTAETKEIFVVDTNDQADIFSIAQEEILPLIDSTSQVNAVTDSTDLSKELEDKQDESRVYGLFIRLLASPDLSSVKFGPAEWGSNFGVLGEYAFGQRLSVSTGIIRSRKNYESYQEQAYGGDARHLEGSCNILDVPLNITYYFPSKRRFSAYTTVGASSYLMLREDYIYTIKSSTGDRVYPYQAIRKNNEWFKILNLSMGLQYNLAPRWQVQVEPFIKIPLADLGDRNVRLSSLGAFVALRYQINSESKNHNP